MTNASETSPITPYFASQNVTTNDRNIYKLLVSVDIIMCMATVLLCAKCEAVKKTLPLGQ